MWNMLTRALYKAPVYIDKGLELGCFMDLGWVMVRGTQANIYNCVNDGLNILV